MGYPDRPENYENATSIVWCQFEGHKENIGKLEKKLKAEKLNWESKS